MFSKPILKSFFLLIPFFLLAEDEIEIPLATKQNVYNVYLSKMTASDETVHLKYCKEIYTTVVFDLNNSGFTSILAEDPEKEAQVSLSDDQVALDPSFWKRKGISFVIQPRFSENTLSLRVYDVSMQTTKDYTSDYLTGTLLNDRQTIHQFLSSVQKDLFGVEGIFHKKILFSKRIQNVEVSAGWTSEIWLCDFDGKNERQLTFEKNYCLSPRFIPDRPQNFLYVSYKTGQSKIFLGSLENKSCMAIIPLRGNQVLPSLGTKSDRLAFICDAAGRPDLFIQYFDTRGELLGRPWQVFSFPKATQASPTFSPDGNQIAFVSDKDGPPRIYSLDISKKKKVEKMLPQLITTKNRQNTSPSWSPDGTKLAYSAKTDGIRQIWIYDFEKKEEWQLTFTDKNFENPIWASDSIHLLFNSEDKDTSELYIANIYQSNPVKITDGIGQKRFPAWQP